MEFGAIKQEDISGIFAYWPRGGNISGGNLMTRQGKKTFVFLLSWLAVLPLLLGQAGALGQAEQAALAVRGLVETYSANPLTAEDQELWRRRREVALDAITAAGPLARVPLREALQRPEVGPAPAYTLATLLLLSEGPGAGEFLLGALARQPPQEALSEAFYFGHTLAVFSPADFPPLGERLLDLPATTQFSLPAEAISFPFISGVAYLYAASEGRGLGALAQQAGDLEKLPLGRAEAAVRVAVHLNLVQITPRLLEKPRKLPGDSPYLRVVVWALGQLGGLSAVEPLARVAAKNKRAQIREEAAFALTEMRSRLCEPGLLELTRDPEPAVRGTAIAGLAYLRTPKALGTLLDALGGPEKDPKVREDYLRAAAVAGDRSWSDALRKAEKNWPSLAVEARETLLALRKIAPRPSGLAPSLWPDLPLENLSADRVTDRLQGVVDAGGVGFPSLKRTVLYSAEGRHVEMLEALRGVTAKELKRANLDSWLDVLETLGLLRKRLRADPWPLFNAGT